LGLVHRNPQLHNILAEFGHWSVDAENAEAIVQALEEIYAKWETDDLKDIQEDPSYTTEQAVRTIYSWVPGNRNNMQDRP
jgi:hypothetical protein